MNRYQIELADNLSELLADDLALRSDVIEEFVTMLGNSKRMHELHEFTAKELESAYL